MLKYESWQLPKARIRWTSPDTRVYEKLKIYKARETTSRYEDFLHNSSSPKYKVTYSQHAYDSVFLKPSGYSHCRWLPIHEWRTSPSK